MKISEFVDKLNTFKEKHGDIDCYCFFNIYDENLVYDDVGETHCFEIHDPKIYYLHVDEYKRFARIDYMTEEDLLDMQEDNDGEYDHENYKKICVIASE